MLHAGLVCTVKGHEGNSICWPFNQHRAIYSIDVNTVFKEPIPYTLCLFSNSFI